MEEDYWAEFQAEFDLENEKQNKPIGKVLSTIKLEDCSETDLENLLTEMRNSFKKGTNKNYLIRLAELILELKRVNIEIDMLVQAQQVNSFPKAA